MTTPFETFFAFGFVSTFVVALLATWVRYGLPLLISLYRTLVCRLYNWNPSTLEKTVYNSQEVTNPQFEIQNISVI